MESGGIMETKLIMVEGIPGSGKSSFARRIAQYYEKQDVKVNLYNEGDYHPADLSWCAYVSKEEYGQILARYAGYADAIKAKTVFEGDYAIIAYTKIIMDSYDFYEDMERYELGDSRTDFDRFTDIYRKRWKAFAEKAAQEDALNVFECVFFQNHVNELLFYRLKDIPFMIAYFNQLADAVKTLNPVLVYLNQPDVKTTIERVAKERVHPHMNWIDQVMEYIEHTPYGKLHNRKGLDGALQCFEERRQTELTLIKKLPLKTILLDNYDYDWERMWQELARQLP